MTTVTPNMTLNRAIAWVYFATRVKDESEQHIMRKWLQDNFDDHQIKLIGELLEFSPIVNLRKVKSQKKLVQLVCPGCGEVHEYLKVSRPRKYCSDKCRMRVYRRNKKRNDRYLST